MNKSPISKHVLKVIEDCISNYPSDRKQSAVLTALMEVQHENGGYLTEVLMNEVAYLLEMPRVSVYEVASFYSMFQTEPCGRNNVAVCTNVSCMLRGSDEILAHIEKTFDINNIVVDDFPVWNFLRHHLFSELEIKNYNLKNKMKKRSLLRSGVNYFLEKWKN